MTADDESAADQVDPDDKDRRRLLKLLKEVPHWEELVDATPHLWHVQPGSDLAGDDAKTAPYQSSSLARHALAVAVDHLGCLRASLLREANPSEAVVYLHLFAQFTLVRAVIENAACAVWLLGPDDPLTRISRRLALQVKQVKNTDNLYTVLGHQHDKTLHEREEEVRDAGVRAGVPKEQVKKTLKAPDYSVIVQEAAAFTSLPPDTAELAWRGCSGLAHGDMDATLFFTDQQAEITLPDPDMTMIRFTGSLGLLSMFTHIAMIMANRGLELYNERRIYYVARV
ncbi:hypothetical protein HS041_28205 [Planomonospora sp. ID67723]|uniref:hypothetical protein n=1 Tax=Planomonospora sp. ID67723 TaxID=2738134 RepID=UPI0018C37626|nr:hypothetical protein [Planomonospora sp. ID67723]MBG0831618.1 hypothetical protein [Planomonospora sp. ID67723]